MLLKVVFILCLILHSACASSEDPPVVTTSQGRIVGTRFDFSPKDAKLHRSVDAFLGIPYAEAPVGPLRFKPPVAKSWSGEIQATELGNECPQPVLMKFNKWSRPSDEDCLFIDVFVPKALPPEAAVLVHIHGGAYMVGSGILMGMYPTPTAAIGDVIVVTLNYRLGSLGFLSTNDDVIPGNMGLLDQRLALEWVRDNIKAFGGDPNKVTVFGVSAGGSSVGLHMLSPGSAGLFRGAAMQSGNAAAAWATMSASLARSRAFGLGKRLGCERETSEQLLECLQKVDHSDIIEHQAEIKSGNLIELMTFKPVADGDVIPGDPDHLYATGAINDAVSIIGALADEGMLMIVPAFPNNTDEAPFVNRDAYDAQVQVILSWVLTSEPIVAEAAKVMYTNASCNDSPDCDYLESLSQLIGDVMFVCSVEKTAKAFTKAGRKVYRYHMNHIPTTSLTPKWTKAMHGDDFFFLFGVPLDPPENWTFTEEEVRMSIQTIKYWANLAKTGNPNLSSMDAELTDEEKETEWPLFTPEELAYKDLSPTMLNGRAIKAEECLMWNEFIPKLIQIAEEARKCREASNLWDKETKDGDDGQRTCTEETCPEE